MNAAPLCPTCLAANVIATVNGPTCTHVQPNGVKWWPPNWSEFAEMTGAMSETERVAWLEKKQHER